MLLRDRPGGGVEVLLIQRHRASKFAAGDHVFPGGKIEVEDHPDDVTRWCPGLDADGADRLLGATDGSRTALAHWTGAIREAFEEVGVLLAVDETGGPPRLDPDRLAGYRRACQQDHRAFWDLLRAERLTLTVERLAYFAHWITPEENPLRFDTRFFAAVAPPQDPVVDGHEIVALRWLTPAEAMDAFRRKDITLRLPTIKNLELVQSGGTRADEILGSLRGRAVPTIRPRVLQVDGKPVPVLPGDPRWF